MNKQLKKTFMKPFQLFHLLTLDSTTDRTRSSDVYQTLVGRQQPSVGLDFSFVADKELLMQQIEGMCDRLSYTRSFWIHTEQNETKKSVDKRTSLTLQTFQEIWLVEFCYRNLISLFFFTYIPYIFYIYRSTTGIKAEIVAYLFATSGVNTQTNFKVEFRFWRQISFETLAQHSLTVISFVRASRYVRNILCPPEDLQSISFLTWPKSTHPKPPPRQQYLL